MASSSTTGSQRPRMVLLKRSIRLPPPPASTTPAPATTPSPASSAPSPPASTQLPWRRRGSGSSTSSSSGSSQSTTSSSSSAESWRSSSSPPPASKASTPAFGQLQEGDILYLPIQPPSGSVFWEHSNSCSHPEGHPVVVVGKWTDAGEEYVHFRTLTSFSGQRLEQGRSKSHHWRYFMMCQNLQDMAPGMADAPVARMKPGFDVFKKRSYVNLSPNSRFKLEYKHLANFSEYSQLRFDGQSTSDIVNAPYDE